MRVFFCSHIFLTITEKKCVFFLFQILGAPKRDLVRKKWFWELSWIRSQSLLTKYLRNVLQCKCDWFDRDWLTLVYLEKRLCVNVCECKWCSYAGANIWPMLTLYGSESCVIPNNDDQCLSSTAYNFGSSDSRRNSWTYVISFHLLASFSFSTNVE